MSQSTRTKLNALGLLLVGVGSALISLTHGGCATPIPSGRVHLDACSGTGCEPTPPPPPPGR